MINYNNYYYFYYVAKYKGFSNASEKLLISQPALSYSIKKLEQELNEQLFSRYKRKFELTQAGRELYERLKTVEYLLNSDNKNIEQKINIGAIRVVCDSYLEPIILAYKKDNPKDILNINIDEQRSLWSMFERHAIDIVISKEKFQTNEGNYKNIELTAMENCFVCSKQFYEKNKTKIDNLELGDFHFILPTESKKCREIIEYFKMLNFSPFISIGIKNSQLLLKLILDGDYIGYVTADSVKELIKNESLIVINSLKNIPNTTVYLTYDENRLNNKLKVLLKRIANNFKIDIQF